MTAVREKAQGYTRQIIGEMIGDELLVREGKERQQHAEDQRKAPIVDPKGRISADPAAMSVR